MKFYTKTYGLDVIDKAISLYCNYTDFSKLTSLNLLDISKILIVDLLDKQKVKPTDFLSTFVDELLSRDLTDKDNLIANMVGIISMLAKSDYICPDSERFADVVVDVFGNDCVNYFAEEIDYIITNLAPNWYDESTENDIKNEWQNVWQENQL